MGKFKCARKYSTDKIIARAFKEYTEQVSMNYSNMMAVMADINDIVLEESVQRDGTTINEEIESKVAAILESNNISDNDTIILADGVYKIKDVCRSVTLANYIDDIGGSTKYSTDMILTNVQGQTSSVIHSVEDLFTDMNSTYHSTVCTAAVAQSYALGNNISEQVQLARDYVGQKFSSSYSDISGYLEDSINAVKNGASVTEWITGLLKTSGIDDAAENENFTFNNSDSYKYTGATPASALCWSTTKDIVVSTVKVAARAVKTIVGGILKLGKKLFQKVKNKVIQMTVNPYDLEETNKSSDGHTIDGYADQKKIYFDFDDPSPSKYTAYLTTLVDDIEANKYIHTDYFCCEEMLSIQVPTGYKQGFRDPFETLTRITLLDVCRNIFALTWNVPVESIPSHYTISDLLSAEDDTTIWFQLRHFIQMQSPALLNRDMYHFYKKLARSLVENQDNVDFIHFLDKHDVVNINDGEWSLMDMGRLALIACYLHDAHDMFMVSITRYKPIDYKAFKNIFASLPFTRNDVHYEVPTADVISAFDYLTDNGDIYADCGSSELDLYNSFVLGFKCSILLRNLLMEEAIADTEEKEISTTLQYWEYTLSTKGEVHGWFWYPDNNPFRPMNKEEFSNSIFSNVMPLYKDGTTVTNKDFYHVAIGTTLGITYTESIDLGDTVNVYVDKTLSTATLFSILHNYKSQHPLDYEFWPYEKENSSWNDSQFRIKADSENKNYASAFLLAAIVIVAAVVIGFKAKKLIRKKLNTAYIKQQAAQAKAVEAAKAGNLSDKELKEFAKSKKRLNKLNKLFGNSATPASSTASGMLEDISTTQNASENNTNSESILTDVETIQQQSENLLQSNDNILKYITG